MKVWPRPLRSGPKVDGVRPVTTDVATPAPATRSPLARLLEYVRLVGRLMVDARVSLFDRLIVVAAVVYLISPVDLIPDVIPFVGEIDDVVVLVTALTRLFEHAGRDVILSHWRGAVSELDAGWLKKLALVFSFFFPKASRIRLRRFARG